VAQVAESESPAVKRRKKEFQRQLKEVGVEISDATLAKLDLEDVRAIYNRVALALL
jgi:hypothetical protein